MWIRNGNLKYLPISIFVLSFSGIFGAHILNNSIQGNYEFETNLRLFLKIQSELKVLTEFKGRMEIKEDNQVGDQLGPIEGMVYKDRKKELEFRYRSFMLGPYYRLFKNLHLGAFYKLQQGARHDDDWRGKNGLWQWDTTISKRTEHLLIFDVTPRLLLDFLSGENWVAEVKSRFEYNGFNRQQTAIVRPGLTFFGFGKDSSKPLLNFFLQYELWLPVNWGDNAIWETWIYAGFLVHVTDNISVGIHVAEKNTQWSRSAEFIAKQKESSYGDTGKFNSTMFGLNILYNISL